MPKTASAQVWLLSVIGMPRAPPARGEGQLEVSNINVAGKLPHPPTEDLQVPLHNPPTPILCLGIPEGSDIRFPCSFTAFNLKKATVLWEVPLCCHCGWRPPQKDQYVKSGTIHTTVPDGSGEPRK